jgi:hypothetical protein
MRRRLITPPDVQDVFVSGLGRVELLAGGIARFYLYREISQEDEEPEHETVLCVVAPVSAIAAAVEQMVAAIGGKPPTGTGRERRLS